MKQMIIALAVLLSACSKPEQRTAIATLFYRIEQTDLDGTITLSPVKRITLDVNSATSDDDDDDDEDEDDDDDNEDNEGDDDDDDHGCTTLAIDFESISVSQTKTGTVRINWQATDESSVDHYSVQKSTDCRSWQNRSFTVPNSSGQYSVLDHN
jgi:hypothetical protein